MLKGFKEFILRGNAVDLAVGVIVGAAFNNIVSSIVKDLITPLIGAFVNTSDFSSLYFTIHGSKFAYGDFFNSLLSFFIIATVVYFFVVIPINKLTARLHKGPPPEATTKKCSECLSEIPIKATRCAYCTRPAK
jgi:large conductance mechanosensitive channel